MTRLLRDALPSQNKGDAAAEPLEGGIDVVGDIAIVKLRPGMEARRAEVASAIMAGMNNVRAVYGQEGGIEGEYRLRSLVLLGGEPGTLTIHKENGLRLRVDVQTSYFSPRLSTERLRIADQVQDGEAVLNMFAGVGPFSILVAKKRKTARVWSCELNKAAFALHLENNRLNKVEGRIRMVQGDALDLPVTLAAQKFDRILMVHPSRSNAFLPAALSLSKPGCVIYYYRHVTGRSIEEADRNLEREITSIAGAEKELTIRKVREIGPRYLELVAEIRA